MYRAGLIDLSGKEYGLKPNFNQKRALRSLHPYPPKSAPAKGSLVIALVRVCVCRSLDISDNAP